MGDASSSEPPPERCQQPRNPMGRTFNERAERRHRRTASCVFLEVQPVFRLVLCARERYGQILVDDVPGIAIADVMNAVHVCLSGCMVLIRQIHRSTNSTLIYLSYAFSEVSKYQGSHLPSYRENPDTGETGAKTTVRTGKFAAGSAALVDQDIPEHDRPSAPCDPRCRQTNHSSAVGPRSRRNRSFPTHKYIEPGQKREQSGVRFRDLVSKCGIPPARNALANPDVKSAVRTQSLIATAFSGG
jgi:hypothetical protein